MDPLPERERLFLECSYQSFLHFLSQPRDLSLKDFIDFVVKNVLFFQRHHSRFFIWHDPILFHLVHKVDFLVSLYNKGWQNEDMVILWNKDTLLHQAAKQGSIASAKWLVNKLRIDPFVKNNEGYTPFEYAVIHGNLPIVKYYLDELGAEPLITVQPKNEETFQLILNKRLSKIND